MLLYLFKRLLIALPTLFGVCLLTFLISKNVPGNPVEERLKESEFSTFSITNPHLVKSYREIERQLGLDIPLFYFNIQSNIYPDTLYKIIDGPTKEALKKHCFSLGNWTELELFYREIVAFESSLYSTKEVEQNLLGSLYIARTSLHIDVIDSSLRQAAKYGASYQNEINSLVHLFETAKSNPSNQVYVPSLNFYGTNNQFHKWCFGNRTSGGILLGNFGKDQITGLPVSNTLLTALPKTLWLTISSLLISIILSVVFGVVSARFQNQTIDKIISGIVFFLYALPGYWVGTLMLIFLTSGEFLAWFPSTGTSPKDASLWVRIHHTLLPVTCLVYPSLAFLVRLVRSKMIETKLLPFTNAVLAKGVSRNSLYTKHILKNALFPLITVIGKLFPYALSGALVVEIIFSINGIGRVTFNALLAQNYNVVYGSVILSASLTIVGLLVSDVIYQLLDPRTKHALN